MTKLIDNILVAVVIFIVGIVGILIMSSLINTTQFSVGTQNLVNQFPIILATLIILGGLLSIVISASRISSKFD